MVNFNEIEKYTYSLEKNITELKNEIQRQKVLQQQIIYDERRHNPMIVKKVIKHLSCGYSVPDAIILTAIELNLPIKRIRAVFDVHKIGTKHINIFARKFLVKKLYDYGFSPSQIAKIAGISKQSVFKHIKSDCLFI